MTGPVLTCPECGNVDGNNSELDVGFPVYWDPERKQWIADLDIMRDMLGDIAAEVTERANGGERPDEVSCGECDHEWRLESS